MTRHLEDTRDRTNAGHATDASAGSTERVGALERVRRTETVADRIDFDSLRRELPPGWTARPDLVQFGAEPLSETVLFRRTVAGPRLALLPVDPSDPSGEIEFYEQRDVRASRRRTMSVGPLSDALRVAVNRIHQIDD